MRMMMMGLIALSLGSAPAMADDRLSCEELGALVEILDYVADEVQDVDASDVRGDGEFDDAVLALSEGLEALAVIEDDDGLDRAASAMLEVWDTDGPWTDDQLDDFKLSLDSAVMSVDRLHYRDCS